MTDNTDCLSVTSDWSSISTTDLEDKDTPLITEEENCYMYIKNILYKIDKDIAEIQNTMCEMVSRCISST